MTITARRSNMKEEPSWIPTWPEFLGHCCSQKHYPSSEQKSPNRLPWKDIFLLMDMTSSYTLKGHACISSGDGCGIFGLGIICGLGTCYISHVQHHFKSFSFFSLFSLWFNVLNHKTFMPLLQNCASTKIIFRNLFLFLLRVSSGFFRW